MSFRRAPFNERSLQGCDAALVVSGVERVDATLKQLPNTATLRALKARSHIGGATPTLHAPLSNRRCTVMSVAFATDALSVFAALSFAAKLVKEANISSAQCIALVVLGLSPGQTSIMQEALLAALLAAHAPLPQLKKKAKPASSLHEIVVFHSGPRPDHSRTLATNAGNHLARWLTSLPPNRLDSETYIDALRTLSKQQRWQYQFLDEKALQREGAGAFLAVARANPHRRAGIVRLTYRPNGAKNNAPVAIVGKGVCFDTGGINLKPHKSMYLMHEDMMGSAVAVGTLLALTRLQAPIAVDCWLAITENEIGPRAYRPQEIVTAANGVTIQVVHSDAEGRMALADTLALASRQRPRALIDFATLTGACVMALTERMSGVFSNRTDLRSALEEAGQRSGERVWSFPMDEDFDCDLESSRADILQCTPDSKGDHILAARFLSRFVDPRIDWVHVDLSSANRSGGLAHVPSDCTGFGVRFAVEWLLSRYGARQTSHKTSE